MKYILLLFVCIFGMSACSEHITPGIEDEQPDIDLSYVLFTPGITDITDTETQVKDLTILAFDAYTKELKLVKQTTLDEASRKQLEIYPGVYDFYFLGNIASQRINWVSIKNVAQLSKLKLKTSWGKSEISKYGIPMVDLIQNVHVPINNSDTSPTLFKDLEGGREIALLRTMSKIDIKLVGSGFLSQATRSNHQIASIKLMNMAKHISPFQTNDAKISVVDIPLNMEVINANDISLEKSVYVPNININSNLVWAIDSKDIPYLKIRLHTGEEFQTPLVSNHNRGWKVGYMDFAVGAKLGPNKERPIYSICANTNYKYRFKLDNNELKVDLSIAPWIREDVINEDYLKPDYQGSTIYLTDKSQFIGNRIQIKEGELSPYFFMWLKYPENASWRLNITNGLNFKFNESKSCGVANPDQSGAHYLHVTSRIVPSNNATACTDVYFTVNNREVPMFVVFNDGSYKEFYGNNRLKIELIN